MKITYQIVYAEELYGKTAYNDFVDFFHAQDLPSNLTISGDGLVSGLLNETGRFASTILGHSSGGTGASILDLTVLPQPAPQITSTDLVTHETGTPFNYQIEAIVRKYPILSYAASNLPNGLSVNTSTGLISGTPPIDPAETPLFNFIGQVKATNQVGLGQRDLYFRLIQRPVITSSTSPVIFSRGDNFSYNITATKTPLIYNATPLPPGLSVNTNSGLISGTIGNSAIGDYDCIISADNSYLVGSEHLHLIVYVIPNISYGGVGNHIYDYGQTVSIPINIIEAYPSPSFQWDRETYCTNLFPLPDIGLTLNPSTGVFSGTLTEPGTWTLGVTATNAAGSVSVNSWDNDFYITVRSPDSMVTGDTYPGDQKAYMGSFNYLGAWLGIVSNGSSYVLAGRHARPPKIAGFSSYSNTGGPTNEDPVYAQRTTRLDVASSPNAINWTQQTYLSSGSESVSMVKPVQSSGGIFWTFIRKSPNARSLPIDEVTNWNYQTYLYSSSNGTNWSISSNPVSPIVGQSNPTNDYPVSYFNGHHLMGYYHSTDLLNWNSINCDGNPAVNTPNFPSPYRFYVVNSNVFSFYISSVSGPTPTGYGVRHSTNGVDFTSYPNAFPSGYIMAYPDNMSAKDNYPITNGVMLIKLWNPATNILKLYASSDGLNWTQSTSGLPTFSYQYPIPSGNSTVSDPIVVNGKFWVQVDYHIPLTPSQWFYSTNGASWTASSTSPFSNALDCYGRDYNYINDFPNYFSVRSINTNDVA